MTQSSKRSLRLLSVSFAALLGFTLAMIAFYPGYMSQDSISQLEQARKFAFGDWHPPVMGALWHFLDRIVPGPLGMLIFHNLLLWSSLAILCFLAIEAPFLAGLAVIGLGLFPPVFSMVSTIWKDVSLATSLLAATVLLSLYERKRKLILICSASIFLFYGMAVRHNAAPAILPLLVWTGWSLLEKQGLTSIRKFATACLLGGIGFVALWGASALSSRLLTDGKSSYPIQQILVHDLVALSISENQNFVPRALALNQHQFSIPELTAIYTPSNIVTLYCCDSKIPRLALTSDPGLVQEIKTAWFHTIPTHFRRYLKHRWRAFQALANLGSAPVCLPYQPGIEPNPFGLQTTENSFHNRVMRFFDRHKNSIAFRPWAYSLFLMSYLGYSWATQKRKKKKISPAVLAISLSGLLYFLPYLFVATTCDFRMSYWTVISALILPFLSSKKLTNDSSPSTLEPSNS